MKKDILHEFDLAIYPRKLWIAISKSKFEDILEGVVGMEDNCDACVDNAWNKQTKKGGILIRFESKKAMAISNITHESTHAAMEILDYIGAKIDLQNQEYFSYLCGYIAKCCEQVKTNKFK